MARTQSWEVSDAFWQKVEPLAPPPERDPTRDYTRRTGGGRKPIPSRKIFEAILYVLRMGCPRNALSKERFGSPGAIHTAQDVFSRIRSTVEFAENVVGKFIDAVMSDRTTVYGNISQFA